MRIVVLVVVLALGVPLGLVLLAGGDGEREEGRAEAERAATSPASPASLPKPTRGDGKGPPGAKSEPEREPGPPREYPVSANVAEPNDVTPAGSGVARVVERVIGARGQHGQLIVIGADCRAGACSARYVAPKHGRGRMLHDGVTLLRRLFARSEVRRITLYVHGPRGKKDDSVAAQVLAIVRCDRDSAPALRWTRVTRRQIERRCEISTQAGRVGAQIRQGQTSERDASMGRSSERQARGGSSPPVPGAQPPGSPAPRNVDGSKAAEREARKRRGG